MPTTVAAVLVLVGFVLPGFIVVRLSRRSRPYAVAADQIEILLQSLAWAFAIHVVFLMWTARLARQLDQGRGVRDWTQHVGEIGWYGVVVVLLAPFLIGIGLNKWLRYHEESSNQPGLLLRALGAGGPPQAWDKFAFHMGRGGFVVGRTKDGVVLGGKLGRNSWVSASPGSPDMIVEEAWWFDAIGNPVQAFDPPRVVWINAAEMEYLHGIPTPREAGENG